MMATKYAEIVSEEIIKPSSPTPDYHRVYKLSLLDQLAPSHYIPILLFYSASDISAFGTNFTMISNKLKTSLSDVLTLHYPFCGRIIDNFSVECNDAGVLYIESKVPTSLSNILKHPQVHDVKKYFSFDPYSKHAVNMAVELNEFSCGGIGLGVYFSHKIGDGTTAASFLHDWAATAKGVCNIVAPQMEAAMLFPPRDIELSTTSDMILSSHNSKTVTRRFIFNGTSLSRLRAKLGSFNPTRVEAVTALIWKSAMEAAKACSPEETLHASMLAHTVNIRSRMVPPLSKNMFGNLCQSASSPMMEKDGKVGLHDLAEIVRETVKKFDAYYVSKLQGDELPKVLESLKELTFRIAKNDISCYGFSSWTRFGFYETDFGWGKPTWMCTIGYPAKNVTLFMDTKNGDGIEAWVTLTKHDMVEFERNSDLLQFASFDS